MTTLSLSQLISNLDETSSISEGMEVYGKIHQLSQDIASCTSGWIFRIGKKYYEENINSELAFQKVGKELADKFKTDLQKGIDDLISIEGREAFEDENGYMTLKLSGSSPLSSAFRKMYAGLEKGIDLDLCTSLRGVQDAVTKKNKDRAKAESDQENSEKLIAKIKDNILTENPELENNEVELNKAIESEFNRIQEQRAKNASIAKTIDKNKSEVQLDTDFIFSDKTIAKAIADYVEVLKERVLYHGQATGLDNAIIIKQTVDAIEGDIVAQYTRVLDWQAQIQSSVQSLKEALVA